MRSTLVSTASNALTQIVVRSVVHSFTGVVFISFSIDVWLDVCDRLSVCDCLLCAVVACLTVCIHCDDDDDADADETS